MTALLEGIRACKDFYADDPLRDDQDRSEWPANPYPDCTPENAAWRRGWNTYFSPQWSPAKAAAR